MKDLTSATTFSLPILYTMFEASVQIKITLCTIKILEVCDGHGVW